MSSSAHRPETIALPSKTFSSGFDAAEEAASDAAAEAAAWEDAAARDALSASRSRSLTTVYQVWVAQSSTWGAANHAAASTTATSTTMPTILRMRMPRL